MIRPAAWLTPTLAIALASLASPAAAQSLEPPPGYPGSTSPSQPPGYASGSSAGTSPTNNPAINNADEAKDSGLGLEWVYLNGDVGGGFASMDSFSAQSMGLQKTSSSGPAFGVGGGVRLLFLSVGVRARDLQLSGIGDLWELNLEGAFHTRIGHIDGYFGVRGGYNFVGTLNSQTANVATGDNSSVTVHGFNVGPMLGIDFYLVKYVSIGVDADVQFLFLQRPQLSLPPGGQAAIAACGAQCQTLYNQSGNSVGFGFVPTAHLGIHF
jgi:hypothetical protein